MQHEEFFKKELAGSTVATTRNKKTGESKNLTPSEVRNAGLIDQIPSSGYRDIFQTKDGKWTTEQPGNISIDLNKTTGKITVTAPDYILNRDIFKEDYIKLLKGYSANYKADKNTTYIDESNENAKGRTTEEMLAEMQEALSSEEFVNNAKTLDQIRKYEEKKTGWEFTDNEIVRSRTFAVGDEAKDDSLQVVPALDLFTKLESYDPETGAVTRKDLLENAWSREKTSDGDLIDIYRDTLEYINKDYTSDKSEDAKEKYIRATAFSTFLTAGPGPSVSLIRDTGDNIGRFLYGVGSTAGEIEGVIADFLTGLTGNEGTVAEETRKLRAEHMEETKILNPDGVAFEVFGEITVHIVNSIAAGKAASGAVGVLSTVLAKLSGVEKAVKALTSVDGLIYAYSKGAMTIGTATEIAMQQTKFAAFMKPALSAILWLSSGSSVANMVNGAVKVLAGGAKVFTEALASGILEAAVNNPELLQRVLKNKELTPEARSAVMTEFAWNVGGWGAGVTVGKGLAAFGETKFGRVLSDNWAIANAKLQTKTGAIADAIKVRFSKYDSIDEIIEAMKDSGKAEKAQKAVLNQALRSSIANLAGTERITLSQLMSGGDELTDAIRRVDEAVSEVRAAQNAITDFERGAGSIIHRWFVSDRSFRESYEQVQKNFDKVTKIEKSMGLEARAISNEEFAQSGRLFSQTTTDYIGAKNAQVRVNWLILHQGETEELAKAAEDISSKIAAFRRIAPEGSELAKAADEFIVSQRALYYNMTNLFVAEGLENRSLIDSLRASGEWGKDGTEYVYTMRQAELSDIQIMNRNGTFKAKTFAEDQHLAYGATGPYADPILAIEDKLIEHAKIYQRRQLYKAFGDTDFVNKVVRISSEESEMVRLVTPKVRKNYQKQILERLRGTSENLIKSEISDYLSDIGKNNETFAKGAKGVETKTKRMQKVAERTWKADASDRTAYIMSMYGEDLSQAMDEVYGVTDFARMNFNDFYGQLDKTAKHYLDVKLSDFSENYLGVKLLDDAAVKADTFRRMLTEMDNGDDIARGILANTKTYRDSKWIADLASAQVTSMKQAEWILKYQDEINNLVLKMNTALLDNRVTREQMQIVIDNALNGFVNEAANDADVIKALAPVFEATGGVLDDATKQYLVLQTALKNRTLFKEVAGEAISGSLTTKIPDEEMKALTNQLYDLLVKRSNDMWNSLGDQLRAAGSTIPDTEDFFKQVKDAAEEITELKGAKNIIVMGDQNGALQYVQVNPLFADLMNYQPPYKDMGKIAKINYLWSKLWRMNTVNLSFSSLVNQQFKDSINAFVGGGAFHTTQKLIDNLSPVFGDDVVEYFREFEPSTLEYLAKQAGGSEDVAKRLATEELLTRGKKIQSETIETKAYQLSRETRYAQFIEGKDQASILDKAIRKLDDFMNSKWSINRINDLREGMLRSSVYANAMSTGLKRGYTIEQATTFATQLMDDATTNFSRSMYHLKSLQKTVPFLGAAVNGTKSFWRLAMLDPVSVFGRLIGGAAIPTMALTAMSLGSEENREAWKNLKEYEKDGNIVFAISGQIYTIPLPEELGAFINPFRQLVEGMNGSANHSFWELAANDLLDISPIDLTGFSQIDAYTLMKDPTVWDRVDGGILRLCSQLLPTPLRAAVTAISGRDLYTGRVIDRTYKQFNEELGTSEVMGDYSGQFAKALANLFGGDTKEYADKSWWERILTSAPMIEAIFSNIVGKTGVDFANTMANYGALAFANEEFQHQIGATGDYILSMPLERLTSPLTVYQGKSLAQKAWNDAIAELYDEKERILKYDTTYQGLVKAINDATTAEAREIATNKRNAYLEPFYEQIKTVVDRLNTEYQSEFTARKYASVLSLANFGTEILGTGSAKSSLVSKELYYEGKKQAVGTMVKLGFSNADSGIFGTMKRNSNGEVYFNYATPLAILNAENAVYYSGETFKDNLEKILSENGIKRSDMFGDEYNKAKKNKTSLKEYKSAWNTKVVMALAPYIRKYGVEQVLDNTSVVDMLDQYIFVDNPWNAKKYLKTIFKESK